ncbi:uncharacterized protein LOC107274000 isoform X2 [Cephus cinctus]|uniref:Uncharacterized protein LOC107274000 isoform X2 n=1 Tax=Cephus cinctus TaxID=211228 RepID=A0AAJ7W754_CEPCN|nr:uncharacterized protein LOC107274000 isoform X2 [Cephus cinctus]
MEGRMKLLVTMCFLMACHYSYGQSSQTTSSLRSPAIVREPSNQQVANEHRNTLLDYVNPTEKGNGLPRANGKLGTPLLGHADRIVESEIKKLNAEKERTKNEAISKSTNPLYSRTNSREELLRENQDEDNSTKNLLENRERHIGHLGIFDPRNVPHQQSTNMRPARSYFLELYDTKDFFKPTRNRRLYETDKNLQNQIRNYNTRYGAPRYGNQQPFKNPLIDNLQLRNSDGFKRTIRNSQIVENNLKRPAKSLSISQNNNEFRPSPEIQEAEQDNSARLFRVNPAQINALQGVFDNAKILDDGLIKKLSFREPRIIVQRTNNHPANYVDSNSETRTVQELVNLIGQNPEQQLQGLNILLGPEHPREIIPVSEVPVPYEQTFVTPLPAETPGSPNTIYQEGTLDYSQSNNDHSGYKPIGHTGIQKGVVNFTNGQTAPPVWIEEGDLPDGKVDFEKSKNDGREDPSSEKDYEQYASKYSFGYHVTDPDTGNDFSHHEKRDGDITTGRYHVLLPDGRIQSVNYHVDDKGYHAKVSYRLNRGD